MKIREYGISCIFDMPTQKPHQKYNDENIQKFTTSKSGIYKTWMEKRKNIPYIIIQVILLLQLNIKINRVLHYFKIKVYFKENFNTNMTG